MVASISSRLFRLRWWQASALACFGYDGGKHSSRLFRLRRDKHQFSPVSATMVASMALACFGYDGGKHQLSPVSAMKIFARLAGKWAKTSSPTLRAECPLLAKEAVSSALPRRKMYKL